MTVASPQTETSSLPKTVALLEEGIAAGLHPGAQLYVSRRGEVLADLGVGLARLEREGAAAVPMAPETLTLWMSSTKPTLAVGLALLWEAGELALDDPIARFVPEFGVGNKEGVTLRHALTHTGGFRRLGLGWPEASWEEIVETIATMKLEPRWVPGEKAGYHLTSSWFMLAEVIRRIDGRPYERFVREAVFEPLAMDDCWVGLPEERIEAYGERIGWTYNTEASSSEASAKEAEAEDREQGSGEKGDREKGDDGDAKAPRRYPWHRPPWITRPSPGGNGYGPIRQLGRFYEELMAIQAGRQGSLLRPQTVEALVARHRVGLFDHTFQHLMDWGLGFIPNSWHYTELEPRRDGDRASPESADAQELPTLPYAYGPHASRRVFGHSGYRSSTAFADPEHGLVVALATNGTPTEEAHRRRMTAFTTTLYEELGLAG